MDSGWDAVIHQNDIDINFKTIYFFLKIVECGNLTKASEELFVSQPYLTKTVHLLENRLGFELFSREKNRLILTAKGTEFYKAFKPIIYSIYDNILRIKDIDYPKINIGIDYTIDFIKLIKSEFVSKDFDFDKCSVEYGDFFNLEKDLRDGNIDMVITFEDYAKLFTDAEIVPIGKIKSAIVVSPKSKFAGCESVTKKELVEEKITIFIEGNYTTEMSFLATKGYCEKFGFNPYNVSFAKNYQTALLNILRKNEIIIAHEFLPKFPIDELVTVPFSDKATGLIAVFSKNLSSTKRKMAEMFYNQKG